MSEHEKCSWEKRYDELHDIDGPMPGPWNWEIHDYSMATLCGGGEDAITGHIMAISPCGSCVERAKGEEWEWGRCQTPSLANARLIAAAPELLAALREIAEAKPEYSTTLNAGENPVAFYNRLRDMARAAIAKATGAA